MGFSWPMAQATRARLVGVPLLISLASKQQLAAVASSLVRRSTLRPSCALLACTFSNPGLYATVSTQGGIFWLSLLQSNHHTPIQHAVFFQYTEQLATPDGSCVLRGVYYVLPPPAWTAGGRYIRFCPFPLGSEANGLNL